MLSFILILKIHFLLGGAELKTTTKKSLVISTKKWMDKIIKIFVLKA